MKNITIIGSGSFGCALANVLAIENNVKIWSFKEEESKIINEEHRCMFIDGSTLNKKIKCYTNYNDALTDSDYVFIVTPSNVFRNTIKDIKDMINGMKVLIASKGYERESNRSLYAVAKEEIDNDIYELSGPSLAHEVINNESTIISLAPKSKEIKDLFKETNIKIEDTNDYIGVSLGGTLKNIFALACGMLNQKEDLKSLAIIKGLKEMEKIGDVLGAEEKTFYGPSGLGDLILTCNSKSSRNYRAGMLFSEGKNISEVRKKIGMVIEGLDALIIAHNISKKYGLKLNIINKLYEIIYLDADKSDLIKKIME